MKLAPFLLTLGWLASGFTGAHAAFLVDPAEGVALWNDAATADDAVRRGRALGFTFPFLEVGDTTTVDVSTNGHLNLEGDAGYANELGPGLIPRIAPLFDDLAVLAGSGDSVVENVQPGKYYAVTWRVHQTSSAAVRHAFQVILFGAPTTLRGIDFAAGDIVFCYESLGSSFWKDSASVGLDFGSGDTVLAAAGANPATGLITRAEAMALPTGPGGYILFRKNEDGEYVAETRVNRPPQPANDLRYLAGTGPVILDVLTNDTDPDGNPLVVSAVGPGRVGEVERSNDGRLIYTPGVNFAGSDEFTYTVRDPFGLTATARVSLLPFAAGRGTFDGLLRDLPASEEEEAVPTADGVGRLQLVLGPNGVFTGTLIFGSWKTTLKGAFDASGRYVATAERLVEEELRSVTLVLQLDLDNADRPITGTIDDGVVKSAITAARSRYQARRLPAPQAGVYTAKVLPEDGTAGPDGIGFARILVNRSGNVSVSGRLSDGTRFSQGTRVMPDGSFPLYASVPIKRGVNASVSGFVRFDESAAESDLTAALVWFRPDTDETSGFEAAPELVGARYQPPLPGRCILPLPPLPGNASVALGSGTEWRVATLAPVPQKELKIEGELPSRVKLAILPATGMFTGFVTLETADAVPKLKACKVNGMFVTKAKSGGGFYLDVDGNSVPVLIAPASAAAAAP